MTSQVSLTAPQTPRREGAIRPIPARAVPGYHSLDPDARVFPLYAPDTSVLADETEKLFEAGATMAPTMVAPEWVTAAQAVLCGTHKEAGEAVFYAIVAVTHSPAWLASQPVESDEFATVPLPAEPRDLARAADLGRRITDLFDTHTPVTGVTHGKIDQTLSHLGVPDAVTGTVALEGRFGVTGGLRSGTRVEWSQRGVSEKMHQFAEVIPDQDAVVIADPA